MANNISIVNLVATQNTLYSSTAIFSNIFIISLGHSNIGAGEIQTIYNDESYIKNIYELTGEVKNMIDTFFAYSSAKPVKLVELGAVTEEDTLDKKVGVLKSKLTNGELIGMFYCMPKEFLSNNAFVQLATAFNITNSMTTFFIQIPKDLDVITDTNIPKFKGLKSMCLVYEQFELENIHALGVMAGVYMNYYSNINSTNKLSPFSYKFINHQVRDLTRSEISAFTSNNIIFFANVISKPCFMNAKTQDSNRLEYWIAYLNVSLRLVDALTSQLINSANSKTGGAIRYNELGILGLKSLIESQLQTAQDLFLITEFGSSYSTDDQAVENIGSISYTPFQTYIKDNPKDYQDGIYNGFKTVIRITQFIFELNVYVELV